MDTKSDSDLLKPLPAASSTPKSGRKGSKKDTTPKPKKRIIDTLEKALERIDELELALKNEEWKKKDMKEKHLKRIANLKAEWAARVEKLDEKILEKNKLLRQKNNALKKDKAGFDEALAILGKTRRDLV